MSEEEPKKVPPHITRKRRKLARRMRWFVPPPSRDIDLMKPESFTGPFCGCGGRESDGVCWRCLSASSDELFS